MKVITLENIGNVTLKKSNKAKRLIIKLKSANDISVSMPAGVSFKEAEQFVISKQNWIIKGIKKFNSLGKRKIIFNENSIFHTRSHKLIFNPLRTENISFSIKPNKIVFSYPENANLEQEQVQNFIKKAIIETLRIEAKTYLPKRVSELARQHGFFYKKLSFRNAKTRWGSCSGVDNISLNIHLMRIPDHLSDYVILHELCHTVEKNHSVRFWSLLDKVSGNAKGLDNELKKYTPQL